MGIPVSFQNVCAIDRVASNTESGSRIDGLLPSILNAYGGSKLSGVNGVLAEKTSIFQKAEEPGHSAAQRIRRHQRSHEFSVSWPASLCVRKTRNRQTRAALPAGAWFHGAFQDRTAWTGSCRISSRASVPPRPWWSGAAAIGGGRGRGKKRAWKEQGERYPNSVAWKLRRVCRMVDRAVSPEQLPCTWKMPVHTATMGMGGTSISRFPPGGIRILCLKLPGDSGYLFTVPAPL